MSYNLKSKIEIDYERTWDTSLKPIPKPKSDKTWAKSHKALKDHIRLHYSVVQDDICAYCRLPLRFGSYGEPIEHIFPKSLNSFWMYHPKNLCVSCFGCNTKKIAQPTLVNDISTYSKKYDDYPLRSTSYKIVHPHLDVFSDYIEIEKGIIYKQVKGVRGNKGNNTIDMCELNRLDVMYKRIRHGTKNKKTIYQMALSIVNNPKASTKEKLAASNLVNELLKRFNYKKLLNKIKKKKGKKK